MICDQFVQMSFLFSFISKNLPCTNLTNIQGGLYGTDCTACPAPAFCTLGSILPRQCPAGTFLGTTAAEAESECQDCPQARRAQNGGKGGKVMVGEKVWMAHGSIEQLKRLQQNNHFAINHIFGDVLCLLPWTPWLWLSGLSL